ncbi:DUF4340 domain-containing protein [Caloramator sp. E03]|uniref:DUF4340 domain-containing protein n=1 Tax=Caloramator sp. E03 TaxID=2576307 RepID=UPI00143DDFC3|nr:DUF4340 domain-containing protein [Caloramator sp. E03]
MKSSKKIIFLLIVLCAIIGIYIAKVSYDNKKQSEETDKIQLFKTDKKNIDAIEIKNNKGSFSIKNENNKFTVMNVRYKIDNTSVEEIVSNLCNIEALRLISDKKEDLSRFGLDNPQGQCTIYLKDGTSKKLYLGDVVPGGSAYYVAIGDNKIYTVSDTIGKQMIKSLDDIRDKTIVIANENISGIKISNGNNIIELKSSDGTRWYMEQPYGMSVSADNDKLNSLIYSLKEIYIEGFVEDECKDLSKYGLNKPSLKVDVFEGNNTKSLIFGNKVGEDNIYFKTSDSNSIYMMSLESFNTFNIKPFDIVSKCPVNPLIANIDEMTIVNGKNKYTFTVKKQNSGTNKNNDEVKYIYELNGKQIKDEDFKDMYNKYCNLVVDSQIKNVIKGTPDVVITFKLNEGFEKYVKIELIPYNDNFYEMLINGKGDFAISKTQINEFINLVKEKQKS